MPKNLSQVSELSDDMSAEKLTKLYQYAKERIQQEVVVSDNSADVNLKVTEQALKSDQNNDLRLAILSDLLCTQVISHPKSADWAMPLLEKILISDEVGFGAPDHPWSRLQYRMIEKPETVDFVLPVLERIFKSGKKSEYSSDSLATIVRIKPELAERVLTDVEEVLKSDKNEVGFSILGTIARVKPELTDRVLTDMKENLKSDKSTSTRNYVRNLSAMYALEDMMGHNHETVDHVLPLLQTVRKNLEDIFKVNQNGALTSKEKSCKKEASKSPVKMILRQKRRNSY